MWLERDVDCLMTRTKNRPLPQQRLQPNTALVFGAIQGALALPVLLLAGVVPAALGLVALLLYVGVYTPMKQRSHCSTWIGGIPGAMPALMGWTAATGRIDAPGLAVFGVLFFWQIPHTHAIGDLSPARVRSGRHEDAARHARSRRRAALDRRVPVRAGHGQHRCRCCSASPARCTSSPRSCSARWC